MPARKSCTEENMSTSYENTPRVANKARKQFAGEISTMLVKVLSPKLSPSIGKQEACDRKSLLLHSSHVVVRLGTE